MANTHLRRTGVKNFLSVFRHSNHKQSQFFCWVFFLVVLSHVFFFPPAGEKKHVVAAGPRHRLPHGWRPGKLT